MSKLESNIGLLRMRDSFIVSIRAALAVNDTVEADRIATEAQRSVGLDRFKLLADARDAKQD